MKKAALLACVGTVALLHSVDVSARDIYQSKTVLENIEFKREIKSNAAEFVIPDSSVEEVKIQPGGSLSTALTSLGYGWSDIHQMLSAMRSVDNPDIIYPGHIVGKSVSSNGFVNILIERPRNKVVKIHSVNNDYIAELLNKSDLKNLKNFSVSATNNTGTVSSDSQKTYRKSSSNDSGVMNRMTSLPKKNYVNNVVPSEPAQVKKTVPQAVKPVVKKEIPKQKESPSVKVSPQKMPDLKSDSPFVRYVYKSEDRVEESKGDDYGIIRDSEERARPRVNLAEERYKKEVERQEKLKKKNTKLIPIPMKLPQGLNFENGKNSFGEKDLTAKPAGRIFDQPTVIALFLEFAIIESSENAWLEMNRLKMILPERFFEGLDLYAEPTGAGESYRIAATGNWSPEEFESYCSVFSSYGETCQVMLRRWN